MAKRVRRNVRRRAQKRTKSSTSGRKRAVVRRAKTARASARRAIRKKVARKKLNRKRAARPSAASAAALRPVAPERLNRSRRVLTEDDTLRTPPSSLDMDRHGSAARTGRKGLEANLRRHNDMSPALTGGDVDADWENAYFSGDEAPGGDNPTPDTDVVDDIGRALGVEYQDNEELQGSEKVTERDTHRWELDPASSDDYKDRT
ncbi:MAG TPA: DUF6335 family protein [Vicinamibacterales bacterium]|nr:DUF6335 family protein [Vicinamibacterales bacterium]